MVLPTLQAGHPAVMVGWDLGVGWLQYLKEYAMGDPTTLETL